LKVTLNWLKEFVDIDLSAAQIAEKLTMLGLEVEDVQQTPRNFSGVVVGRVISVEPHPKAAKLTVCRVDDGRATKTVVCGAPNVQAGAKYPLAQIGAKLGEVSIEERELRGVISQGMLCSEAELGLSDRSQGLMLLPEDATLGTDFKDFLGEQPDTVFDVFITPNRADCLSVIGIARELAAATKRSLRKHPFSIQSTTADIKNYMRVDIKNPQRCYRYSGRLIENIMVESSPSWLAQRLHQVGIRSINNVVDVTNYVMMETGQPLHAFDYALLKGKKIIVRTASAGEQFTTLDDKEHVLNEEALLICDGERPVALAGIMGGQNSEVSDRTMTVFLESAYFEPTGIRKTSGVLGLASESSRRFERGTDPNGTLYALNRAAQLFVEIAHGQIVGEAIDEYPRPVQPLELTLSIERSNSLLGTRLSAVETAAILQRLEIETNVVSAEALQTRIPTFRVDLTRPIDLMEEIACCHGFGAIEPILAPPINQLQEANPRDLYRNKIRQILAGAGMKETIAYNLTSLKHAEMFLNDEKKPVVVLNPISTDLAVFRPNIVLTLLGTTAYNRNRQIQNLRLFEIGDAAWSTDGIHEERPQIGGIVAGERVQKSWSQQAAMFDFYDVKGVVEHLLLKADIKDVGWCSPKELFWDAHSVGVSINGEYEGAFGKINKDICSQFKLKICDVFAFWLDFNLLDAHRQLSKQYDPVPRFPTVPFDLALVMDDEIEIGRVEKAIRESGKPYLRSLHLFDFYQGEQVKSGKKSIAFSLTFSSKERTLNEDEVNAAVEHILIHLKKQFGAELRPS
jgi:phenylalanyl-tRNA synthetase beta chain